MKFIKSAIFAAALALCAVCYSSPQKVIFDTDMGNDVDDALALAMLYGYHKSGKAELAGILVNKGNPNAPKFCAALNKYYGCPPFLSDLSPMERLRKTELSTQKFSRKKMRTARQNTHLKCPAAVFRTP